MPFDPTPAPRLTTDTAINPATAPHIFLDTEFRLDDAEPVLLCALLSGERITFDLRSGDYTALRNFVAHWIAQGAIWFAFAASAELSIVACDWSQQEIVIAAAMSGDHALRRAIETGDDSA